MSKITVMNIHHGDHRHVSAQLSLLPVVEREVFDHPVNFALDEAFRRAAFLPPVQRAVRAATVLAGVEVERKGVATLEDDVVLHAVERARDSHLVTAGVWGDLVVTSRLHGRGQPFQVVEEAQLRT